MYLSKSNWLQYISILKYSLRTKMYFWGDIPPGKPQTKLVTAVAVDKANPSVHFYSEMEVTAQLHGRERSFLLLKQIPASQYQR